ncbi:putative methyltransferase-like protein 7A isoform X2 [Sphaerodactylus townsendi]|uniref:putative methyltransferase-like protein 7A isoform X2 n=1 Tax=Sphaerodactylus townsendi TaxID=933632 RepID=UPI002026564F|nr:putative methyltransferase-like protein 7A isoform X2 [Sphaerodactylus townsendi]
MESSWLVILLRTGVQLLALPIYLLWYLGLWGPFCKKAFPHVMAQVAVSYNKKMFSKKKELFSNLKDFAGPSGELTLLEIGAGTGANFEFYPAGCRLICNDSNDNFNKFLYKSLSQNPHLQLERCVIAPAEDLQQIPNASVDVVVCTLVLCSVKSIERVLSEVCRVLRPGGAFYFLEHVVGPPSSWNLFWQQIYDPVWQILFDDCHLLRETWRDLEKAGFSELKLRHICAPLNWHPTKPHIIGYAVK